MLHVGDFAYAVQDNNGQKGDDYFDTLQDINSQVPYIITPGNQENFDHGNFFNFRFRMPMAQQDYEKNSNHYYSFDMGNTHFSSVNFDYVLVIESRKFDEMLEWFYNDLKKAYERPEIKWIFVFSHHPVYCGNTDPNLPTIDCRTNYLILNQYFDAMKKFGADVFMAGHVHYYERLKIFDKFKPILYDFEIDRLSGKISYYNLSVPLQVINGCAGQSSNWKKQVITSDMDGKAVIHTQCYMTMDVVENRLELKLFRSLDDQILDIVELIKDDNLKKI